MLVCLWNRLGPQFRCFTKVMLTTNAYKLTQNLKILLPDQIPQTLYPPNKFSLFEITTAVQKKLVYPPSLLAQGISDRILNWFSKYSRSKECFYEELSSSNPDVLAMSSREKTEEKNQRTKEKNKIKNYNDYTPKTLNFQLLLVIGNSHRLPHLLRSECLQL